MKKLLALVIAAGLCAGLCGCASTMKIDADVHLIPSITDGSEPDAGLPGEKGENGEQGYDGGSGTRVTSAEDIKKAIAQTTEGGTAEVSLMNDLILSEPLKITADTVIHGNGYKVKFAEGYNAEKTLFENEGTSLTLDKVSFDGEGKDHGQDFIVKNGGTLEITGCEFKNFKGTRAIHSEQHTVNSISDTTFENIELNGKSSNSNSGRACLLWLQGSGNVELNNVTIRNCKVICGENNAYGSGILIYARNGGTNVTANNLIVENNVVSNHVFATYSTTSANTYTFNSGSIKGNTVDGASGGRSEGEFFVVGNLTIGKDMNVQCGITLNNDSDGSVCTLANDGTITGDITSADWAAKDSGLPRYTGTGTHTGNKNNITDLTATTQP